MVVINHNSGAEAIVGTVVKIITKDGATVVTAAIDGVTVAMATDLLAAAIPKPHECSKVIGTADHMAMIEAITAANA